VKLPLPAATVQLGRGPRSSPQDIVDLLLECHARIRRFIALARKLADNADAPSAEVAEAAGQICRYFSEALPLHAADEEQSIVPRLRGLDVNLDVTLDRMTREHGEHAEPLSVLLDLCGRLQSSPTELPRLASGLRATSVGLEQHFQQHLAHEEAHVFVEIRQRLTAETMAQMVQELRNRRQARP
jgi:hemerythrin-like domain-containing protein